MPTLEDTLTLSPKTSPASTDLLPVYDPSELGVCPVKKSTIAQVFSGAVVSLPGPFADDAAAASGGVASGFPYLLTGTPVVIAVRTA